MRILHGILSLSSEEVKTLLINNIALRQTVLDQLQSLDDLIDLSHQVKIPVLKVLFEVLGEEFKSRITLFPTFCATLYYSVAKDAFYLFFKLFFENNLPGISHQKYAPQDLYDFVTTLLRETAEDQRLEMLTFWNTDKQNILDIVNFTPNQYREILNLIPQNQRIEAVKYGGSGFHLAGFYPHILHSVLTLIPEGERIEALQATNGEGFTALHSFARAPVLLMVIMDLVPKSQMIAALKLLDKHNRTILSWAAVSREALSIVFDLFETQEERLRAIKSEQSILRTAVHNLECLEFVLNQYDTDSDRLQAVKTVGTEGNSLLHEAVLSPEALMRLLDLFPSDNEKREAVQVTNEQGDTPAHKSVSKPASLEIILNLFLTDEEKLRLVLQSNEQGDTPLHKSVMHPETLELILNLFSTQEEKLKVLKLVNNSKQSVLYQAVNYPRSFEIIFNLYPREERHEALKSTDSNGSMLLENALCNQDILNTIFSGLSGKQISELLECLLTSDANINYRAFGNLVSVMDFESFKNILKKEHKKILTTITSINDLNSLTQNFDIDKFAEISKYLTGILENLIRNKDDFILLINTLSAEKLSKITPILINKLDHLIDDSIEFIFWLPPGSDTVIEVYKLFENEINNWINNEHDFARLFMHFPEDYQVEFYNKNKKKVLGYISSIFDLINLLNVIDRPCMGIIFKGILTERPDLKKQTINLTNFIHHLPETQRAQLIEELSNQLENIMELYSVMSLMTSQEIENNYQSLEDKINHIILRKEQSFMRNSFYHKEDDKDLRKQACTIYSIALIGWARKIQNYANNELDELQKEQIASACTKILMNAEKLVADEHIGQKSFYPEFQKECHESIEIISNALSQNQSALVLIGKILLSIITGGLVLLASMFNSLYETGKCRVRFFDRPMQLDQISQAVDELGITLQVY